jgi:transporter family-2 protein
MMLGILFSLLAGALLFTARIVNFQLSEHLGSAGGSFANHWIGALAGAVIIVIAQVPFMASATPIAWYAWMGGPIGAAFVIISNLTIDKVSIMVSTTLIFIGQVLMSIVLDFLMTGKLITPKQLLGAALIFSGILLNQKASEKQQRKA